MGRQDGKEQGMEQHTAIAGEVAVARRALQEVSRLASEATTHFEEQEYIEAASALTALTSVLEPLISFMNTHWIEASITEESDRRPVSIGGYL